ncbi:LLM class flavin-dependent oxidoreductase [Microbacterium trichothecenolyticum]|uniref:FMN-dependent oxidoreductase (Nitrilotriacetate monooxygenase family) n=1 Tax=Microbacterium trichothecenolyticum TaxID=69370 RepID=A0ABU0U087_MICTR|nr:LLM class flavin-dependent oxidoreductase [Microbacterium trichothecenolyticum]MDQ1124637.1 FMN-dependent oxidoreductase (nitrilotriacetate monooxygenase family) [Microbacterium trichothecenolyticum]
MSRPRLILNAFTMNVVSHVYHGLWRHPENTQLHLNDLETWIELARIAEEGKFDALFFADVVGIDPAYNGSWDTYIREGLQIPCNDPAALCAALISVTENLGLTFTSSILSEHPFSFARKVSTMDQLSKGRIGWNIVTSVSHNAAQNYGLDEIVAHDRRYEWAEEYMDVVYKLWEGSWDEGAVLADREAGVYADKDKIHRIYHQGESYRVMGPHLVAPSRQRTPVLYQAGASGRGREFAAKHAEGTFVVFPSIDGARRGIAEQRAIAVRNGRRADDLKFIQGMSFVIGSTEEEAQRKAAEIDEWVSYEGLAAHISRDMGIDLAQFDPEMPIEQTDVVGVQGFARVFEDANPGKKARVADVAGALSYNLRMVGTPESIADRLEQWQDAGVDGLNIIAQHLPGSYRDFVEHVIPVLQERGLAQREYAPGTLRERLFPGSGGRLAERHPAAQYRGAFQAEDVLSASGTGAAWR